MIAWSTENGRNRNHYPLNGGGFLLVIVVKGEEKNKILARHSKEINEGLSEEVRLGRLMGEGVRMGTHYTKLDGRWRRKVSVSQCPCDNPFLIGMRCQGVEGHRGVHWAYAQNGSFVYVHNDLDPIDEENAAGWCPPGHKDYPHPTTMQSLCYREFFEYVEVTDPVEIARLEKGQLNDGDSMSRPMTKEEER